MFAFRLIGEHQVRVDIAGTVDIYLVIYERIKLSGVADLTRLSREKGMFVWSRRLKNLEAGTVPAYEEPFISNYL